MYKNPAVGTILLAQPNTTVVNPGPIHSGHADALNEWEQAQAQATAFQKNTILVEDWTNTIMSDWLSGYLAGRKEGPTGIVGDPDAIPPTPPAAWVVVVIAARPSGAITFDVQPSGMPAVYDDDDALTLVSPSTGPYVPVCAVPPYTKIPAPQKPGTGRIK